MSGIARQGRRHLIYIPYSAGFGIARDAAHCVHVDVRVPCTCHLLAGRGPDQPAHPAARPGERDIRPCGAAVGSLPGGVMHIMHLHLPLA